MKTLKIFTIIAIFFIAGCTEDFEEINSNPNEPETVLPNLLLSTIISDAMNTYVRDIGWSKGNLTAQLTAKINFTGFDRYDWGSETGTWNSLYGNLTEVEELLEIARAEETANTSYEGMALVMKAFIFSILTDNWGDVPYTETIKAKSEDIFAPTFDTQQSIYEGILADLETANDLLKQGAPIFGGDLFYDGDIDKWVRLTNSLRMRYLMRISNVSDVSVEMQQIVDNEMLFESNADNALIVYGANGRADSWPVSVARVGSFDEYRLSTTSETVLKDFNDGRLFAWFQPTDNPNDDPDLYAGMPNGLSEDNASNYNGGASNVSRLRQSFFFDSPNSVRPTLMQYAELQFIMAEAAQRGLITGDAQTYYENGITASFEFWGVDDDLTTYLVQPGVAYDDDLETIITQKWLASFLVGAEAWYDFRRTGFPSVIVPGPDNVNGDRVPVKFIYPDVEQTLNTENYQDAVSRLGGTDNINAPGWWESN